MEPRHEMLNWQVFTDGASSPDGRGGWAYVVVKDDVEIRREQGSALGVTHQRMEIRAVAEALLAFPCDVGDLGRGPVRRCVRVEARGSAHGCGNR
jgi:hypothetical protein